MATWLRIVLHAPYRALSLVPRRQVTAAAAPYGNHIGTGLTGLTVLAEECVTYFTFDFKTFLSF
jgi:hypothetical protein